MRTANGLPIGGAKCSREKIGPCGGVVGGLSQSLDGAYIYLHTDAFGGSVKGPSDDKWRAFVTALTVPSANQVDNESIADGSVTHTDGLGVAEVVCAPSDGTIALMQWCGWTFLTKDAGATWVDSLLPRKTLYVNANASRIYGRSIAIHPTDPNKAIVGTQGEDVYVTTNLQAATPTWTALGMPAGSTEPNGRCPMQHLVAFNPVNPSEVFIAIWGTGIKKSSTGVNGTYSTVTGTSAYKPTRFKFDDEGTLWLAHFAAANNLYKMANGGSSFTNVTTLNYQIHDLAINPNTPGHIVAFGVAGDVLQSTNGGSSWPNIWTGDVATVPPKQLIRATTGKALDAGPSREWSPAPNNIEFDRAVANRVILASGVGFLHGTIPATSADPIIWVEDTEDVPMLVTQCGVFAGDGTASYGVHDEGIFAVVDETRYNNIRDHPPGPSDAPHLIAPVLVQPCTDLCVASDNDACVYGFQHGGTWASAGAIVGPINDPHFGYNDNYGRPGHWHAYANQPTRKPFTMGGGCMSVGPVGEVIHFYNANGIPEYTEDNGATAWHSLVSAIPALVVDAFGNLGFEYQGNAGFWLNRKIADYDKAAGKHRFFNYASALGFWEASHPSGPWTHVSSDAPYPSASSSGYVWHCQFFHVPGHANHAFWTNGLGFNDPFMRTTNGCQTWTAVPNVTNVITFHFSAPAPGQSYPCILFHGKVSGVWGFYRSDDNFATTPKFLGTHLMDWLDVPLRIFGNPNVYHDFRICYSGSGAIRCEYEDLLTLA